MDSETKKYIDEQVSKLKPKESISVRLPTLWMMGYLFAIGFTGSDVYIKMVEESFSHGFFDGVFYLFATYLFYPISVGEKLLELLGG